jgi:hypothetical protein
MGSLTGRQKGRGEGEVPAERAALLMLQPHAQTIEVEYMLAGKLLASTHSLPTDQTLMGLKRRIV